MSHLCTLLPAFLPLNTHFYLHAFLHADSLEKIVMWLWTWCLWCSRTFLSIVGGMVAGVLGLTGVTGFLCYFVIMLLASAGIAAKAKFDISSYFDSWNRVTLDGIGQGFMVRLSTFFLLLQALTPSSLKAKWILNAPPALHSLV